MKNAILSFVLLISTLICTAQVQRPTAWLRADSAVLNASSWVDVSGNGLDATPSAGSMPAAFSRMNFNKCFEVGGTETFALQLGINDSKQSDVIVVYETYDTASENALWQVKLDTAKRIGQTTRRILNDNGQITYDTDTAAQLAYLTSLTNRQSDTCDAYWYHPDHLGSSSWITDSAGSPVQHLHYLPWGEDFVNQRLDDFDGVRYTFSAKEKDAETGYSYFGSRYYSSDLSIWLSVDPMAAKYPSLSLYAYCADNPVKLVDPNGEEVEYNSFSDKVFVGLHWLFNNEFRQQFKILKKSEETYVFKNNQDGFNKFTTNGDKLFINYSVQPNNDNGYDPKNDDQTIVSLMRHETTHAVQFENGKLGFYFNNNEWVPRCYDITDEVEAWDNQNSGTRSAPHPNSSFNKWPLGSDIDEKIKYLRNNCPQYNDLRDEQENIYIDKRVKNDKFYFRPHVAGKSFHEPAIIPLDSIIYNDIFRRGDVIDMYILRNDTVFLLRIFNYDSLEILDTNILLYGNWWLKLTDENEENIIFSRYKKIRKPQTIEQINVIFAAESEVDRTKQLVYNQDFKLILHFFKIGNIASCKKIEHPKRKIRKKMLMAYLRRKTAEPVDMNR